MLASKTVTSVDQRTDTLSLRGRTPYKYIIYITFHKQFLYAVLW